VDSVSDATDVGTFTAGMRDSILWVEWGRSVTVSDAMAVALIERANQVCPTVCPPMLVELNGMVTLTRGALHHFATGLNIAAMALVGPSAVDRMLSDFFSRVHHPPYPTSHFGDSRQAIAWLSDHPHSI
jgi:hypothetical protein